MTRTALVLAAHGSREAPSVNARIRDLADRVAKITDFDEVGVAFHQGTPQFSEVLDTLAPDDVTVVPFMTSAGYYCDTVLPRELSSNRRYSQITLRVTAPVGTSPRIAGIVERRAQRIIEQLQLDIRDTGLVLVGHGTERHKQSRASTEELVERLGARGSCGGVFASFLDEPPKVETILDQIEPRNVIVIPFLIGGGAHAVEDIPRRLGLVVGSNASWPMVGSIGGRIVICDEAIGSDSEMVQIVAELVHSPHRSYAKCLTQRRKDAKDFRNGLQTDLCASAPLRESFYVPAEQNDAGHERRVHVKCLRLGTRASAMALWQARHVARRLRDLSVDVEIVELTTSGDRELSVPIADLPSDAPFTDDIDQALINGDIDVAVHALKDLPTFPLSDLRIVATLKRNDASEALVSFGRRRLSELPSCARVGISSPRRVAQLRAMRPDLQAVPIRGPVDRRVRDVLEGRFDAAVLAVAGLERLDLLSEIAQRFSVDEFVPAPGQGALVIQVRAEDDHIVRILAPLNDESTYRVTLAELALLRRLEGLSGTTLAAYATEVKHSISLHGRLMSLDGTRVHDVRTIGSEPQNCADDSASQLEALWFDHAEACA